MYLTPAPPDSRLRWVARDARSLKQDPAAGALRRLRMLRKAHPLAGIIQLYD